MAGKSFGLQSHRVLHSDLRHLLPWYAAEFQRLIRPGASHDVHSETKGLTAADQPPPRAEQLAECWRSVGGLAVFLLDFG